MKLGTTRAMWPGLVLGCVGLVACSSEEDSGNESSAAPSQGGADATGGERDRDSPSTATGGSADGSGGTGAPGDDGLGGTGDGTPGGKPVDVGFADCATTGTLASLGGVPSTHDTAGPNSHSAMYGAKPVLVAAPRTDGSFDFAWQSQSNSSLLYITHVEPKEDDYATVWHLPVESLGRVGGLSLAADGDPVVVTTVDEAIAGDVTPEETHRPRIMELVRVDSDCGETYRADLRTDFDGDSSRLPLYSPMTAGTGRLEVGAGSYVFHYSQNTEYDDNVDSRHQVGRYLVGNAETGELTAVQGNISHSFDQRLHFDGQNFISLSLGDASLRGIALSRTTPQADKTQRTLFAIKGGDNNTGGGYNNTFTRLGDVAHSKSGFVSVFSTEAENTHPERVSFSRNVALTHSPAGFNDLEQSDKYDVVISDTESGNEAAVDWDVSILDYWGNAATGKNRGVVWLTSYEDRETAHAERPKLVRFSEDRFFVIWEKWSLDSYEGTFGMIVDEWGHVIAEEASLGTARLPRGDDAFLLQGQASWLEGTDSGQLVLHRVNSALELTSTTL